MATRLRGIGDAVAGRVVGRFYRRVGGRLGPVFGDVVGVGHVLEVVLGGGFALVGRFGGGVGHGQVPPISSSHSRPLPGLMTAVPADVWAPRVTEADPVAAGVNTWTAVPARNWPTATVVGVRAKVWVVNRLPPPSWNWGWPVAVCWTRNPKALAR